MSLLLPAIAILSAAAVAYEILLMRLFSIIQWHHFVYMIISLALLGYGASGTFLAIARERLLPRFRVVFSAAAGLFGLTAVGCFALAQRVPFNPLEVAWDPHQQIYLLVLYLVLAFPFFCAAGAVGLALARFGDRVHLVYRADLLGAGAGALGIVLALFALSPEGCLRMIGGAGLLAGGLVLAGRPPRVAPAVLLCAAALVSPFLWPRAVLVPLLSPYKGLSQTLRIPGTRVIEERAGPLGTLTVVASERVPFRHAPGMSLHARAPIPPQIAVFTDGDSMTAIARYDGRRESLGYLDFQSAALPYHLLDRPRVLILGAGGGADVLLSLYHRARSVDAVELNPQMVDLVGRAHARFAGEIYGLPRVRIHVGEARDFASRSGERYDLVQVSLLDSFPASAAGLHALSESPLYTVEALETYLGGLAPGGLLAITRWLKLPPRDSLKLFATAVAALERRGAVFPDQGLVLIRSWDTATLLVKNEPFRKGEIGAVRAFCEERGFDAAHYPGMPVAEANRHNVLSRAYLHEGAEALLGPGREAFLRDYKFHVAPATDDRPYFFHFFKWSVLPELLSVWRMGGAGFIEWGYLILVATVFQAGLISVVLILAPLRMLGRAGTAAGGGLFGRVALYFLVLGLAFLFIEMAFIQRFVLFLGHPLYAVAAVLSAFLVCAGMGSGASPRLAGTRCPLSPIALAVLGILAVAGLYLVLLPPLFGWLRPLPGAAKVGISIPLIAPLAFFMGMPFPLGLRRVAGRAPALVPWAWGINGCASVLSAPLATLLAIHFGFTAVVGLALVLYLLAAAAFADGPGDPAAKG